MDTITHDTPRQRPRRRYAVWRLAGLGLVAALWSPPVSLAGGEIVPSIGLTRAADSDDTESNVGLAVRGNLAGPSVGVELGVNYRKDEFFDGALEVKRFPVTASILVWPVNVIHADVGAGWYNTKYNYSDPLIEDETKQEFGVHLGGGLQVPVASRVAADLTGRYVMMRDQESKLVPEKFNPDFWAMSFGLAFKF